MDFKDNYPDFAAIEGHIKRARVERILAIANLLANFVVSIGQGLRNLGNSTGKGLGAERDRSAIEADSVLKRSVPRY